uniref:Uncharacterized protein n=1 Tax=Salix viminalis TaxID=40686 RepID=A0A6N2MKX9_SALVM
MPALLIVPEAAITICAETQHHHLRLSTARPIGAKDKNPRKQKLQQIDDDTLGESSPTNQTSNLMSRSSFKIDPLEEGPPKED